ncbi:MAG: 30S ribosome-binding factor RbfA [Acidobacteria bacterium]|nr:30S ribosome-binding factor RbfA [Acidobacteriota bacterium]MCG3193594.1 Ribosome-binding factor A [Thermoanaerobaculia bacterium]MCK6684370.1 30S ribosome-binding factor RbfA [Thermoanaerobaculia bacterium]
MKETRRTRQVSDVVRAELVRLIREEVHDPEVGFATITGVEISPDLKTARVYVSVLGPAEQFAKTVAALNHARGFLRGPVGRNCGLRYAPELTFVEDHSLERGARIEELLREIHQGEETKGPADGSKDEQ